MSYDYMQGLKGAGGGALAGASVGGPLGALVGGGLGLLGGFGGGENEQDAAMRKRMEEYMNMVGGRQAPQMGAAAQSAYSGFRANQSGLVNRLEAMANGQGPSLAKQQFQQATDRNMRGQQAMAASGRGGPLAQLTAANNMGMLGAQAAQGSALARTNEQMQAIGQLGGVIAQGRGADEQTNMWNAGAQNDQMRGNLEARLRTMGMNDQAIMGIMGQMNGMNARQAGQPGLGDQILAGGAGMFAMGAGQNAQQKIGGGSGPNYSQMSLLPGGSYYTQAPKPQPQMPGNGFGPGGNFNYNGGGGFGNR